MSNLLGLLFEIKASSDGAQAGMREFEQSAGQSLQQVREHIRRTESVSQEFTNFVKSHLIFSVDEFIRLGRDALNAMKSAADLGERIANLSEATGVGAEALSGLEFAAKQSGVQAGALDRALRHLALSISPLASSGSEGRKALQTLGISATDASGHIKPLHNLFLEIAAASHKHADSTEKAAAAQVLLGRSGAELIPLLDRGRDGILAMEGAAKQLGVTLTDKDAKSLRETNEQLKLNDARMKGLELRLSEILLPTFVRLANLLTVNSATWKIWGLNVEAAWYRAHEGVAKLLGLLPKVGSAFRAVAEDDRRTFDQIETETLLIEQHQADLIRTFEGGQKGSAALLLRISQGAHAAKTYADNLSSFLQREKEDVQAFAASQQSSLRQIDLAYQRQVDAAKKAIEADRQLLARKTITLAEEKREEQEYTEFLSFALKLRDEKWKEELDKTQARVQQITAAITQQQQEAHEQLGKTLQASLPQGPQSNPLTDPAMLRNQQLMLQLSHQVVPAISAETRAVWNLQAALTGLGPVIDHVATRFPVMTQVSQQFSQAMGQNIAQAIIYGGSITQAMERALKATVESIAAKAIVQALYATALGFLLLAEFDFPAAAQAFEAAAAFGLVGGAAAAIGATIPGGARGAASRGAGYRAQTGRGGESEGYGESGASVGIGASELAGGAASAAHGPSGNLTVAIMGDNAAGEWLAKTLNTAVEQRGVQLTSTRSTRSAYAQG